MAKTKGFMIAAPRSGSGKTTVTLGLLRALARRGLPVASFKCGPDYIDPAFHKIATGRESYNLDSWAMAGDMLDAIFARGAAGAEVVIAEGSMGLFDGVMKPGASGDGSSADIAARFGLPVMLVIDVSGQSQSAGAVALGFKNFHPDVKITGVILGNVASERHKAQAAHGVERAGIPVLGALPRGGVPVLPERHLGLVQAGEIENISAMIEALADVVEKCVDVEALLNSLPPLRGKAGWGVLQQTQQAELPPTLILPLKGGGDKKRIALARDVAFSFMYPHILAAWKDAGATVLPFSPLNNEAPDPSADLCWLPGGYPELYAEKLSGNRNFLQGLREFTKTKPVHGECGGYMVLGDTLVDKEGKSWPMAGLLPLTTSFAKRKIHLGYRAVTLTADSPIGKNGQLIRGHEFHYASIIEQGTAQALGEATDAGGTALGPVGQKIGPVSGTFFHAVA